MKQHIAKRVYMNFTMGYICICCFLSETHNSMVVIQEKGHVKDFKQLIVSLCIADLFNDM